MKKIIIPLIGCLLFTSCSDSTFVEETYIVESQEMNTKISEESMEVVNEINNLRDKFMKLDYEGVNYLYIDAYEDGEVINDINYDNYRDEKGEYFYEIIEILDGHISSGLKEYIEKVEKKEISEPEVKQFGQTLVYVEPSKSNEKNYVSIKILLSEIKDGDDRILFENISSYKYFLDKTYSGEGFQLIDFLNKEASMSGIRFRNYDDLDSKQIRYSLFLKEGDIKKVNIFIKKYSNAKLSDDDREVFFNLLKEMKLPESEIVTLSDEYKNLFTNDVGIKKIDLDSYKVYINGKKGNEKTSDSKNIYFSIEEK